MTSPLVIYHGGQCLDGFGSAFAAYMYFAVRQEAEADYFAANHGEPIPEHDGRDVYLLDFAYKREQMETLARNANRVVVLDHHISAQRDLEGLDAQYDNLELVFDMERSGCVITWEYFHQAPVPHLLAYIQDRDLWQFRIPDSEHVNSALLSHPLEFDLWRRLIDSDERLHLLIEEGKAINRYRDQMIAFHRKRAVIGEIAGYSVPIVNCPRNITSELLNELADGHPFAAGYADKGTKRGWSLRSRDGGADVSEIAARFGGGGHARAAGFATQLPETLLKLAPED